MIHKERPEYGDTVLFYGQPLLITQLYKDLLGLELARCYDMVFHAKRAQAEQEMKMMMKAPPTPEREYRIRKIAPILNGNCMNVSVRVDKLRWWPEKQAWVSEARVLSDNQKPGLRKLRDHGYLKGNPVTI